MRTFVHDSNGCDREAAFSCRYSIGIRVRFSIFRIRIQSQRCDTIFNLTSTWFSSELNFRLIADMPSVFCFEFLIGRVGRSDNFIPFGIVFFFFFVFGCTTAWPHDLKLLILITFQFMVQLN